MSRANNRNESKCKLDIHRARHDRYTSDAMVEKEWEVVWLQPHLPNPWARHTDEMSWWTQRSNGLLLAAQQIHGSMPSFLVRLPFG